MGYLAGLHELGLIPNVRYISGISGGSWATITYSFAQNGVDDRTLLGPIMMPKDMTYEGLKQMDPQCARSYTDADFVSIALQAYKDGKVDNIADAWVYATQNVYFDPVGIKTSTPFSWSEDVVSDIKSRNFDLRRTDFILPTNAKRPFPMVGTTMVGPTDGGGYEYDIRNMTMIEITPLYIGQMHTQEVGYQYHDILDRLHYRTVGGVVEPFAFGRYGSSPFFGIDEGATTEELSVPHPDDIYDLRYAGGASSYAPGAFVESFDHFDIASTFGMHMNYWSPSDSRPSSEDNLFCDGGSYMNIMLPSMLQRRVQKIVLFLNNNTPLLPASKWNVYEDVPKSEQVSDSLSSLFGVYENDTATWEQRSFDMRYNQVFSGSDWAPVASALQQAQAVGNGIIATFNLTTVENAWWGIPAGITSQITFVYLGRLSGWEKELSAEMRSYLVPEENADDLSIDVDSGPFKGFPHYLTAGGLINHERANALSDLTGWTILKNANLFRSIFSK
jgi:hypothetical protein